MPWPRQGGHGRRLRSNKGNVCRLQRERCQIATAQDGKDHPLPTFEERECHEFRVRAGGRLNITPINATHWLIRSMAAEAGLSRMTIRWLAAAPFGEVQAVERSAVRRQGAGQRWPLPVASAPRGGAMRGREIADPDAR